MNHSMDFSQLTQSGDFTQNGVAEGIAIQKNFGVYVFSYESMPRSGRP
jgi:hypothetical protein